jgi:hypothetical protein
LGAPTRRDLVLEDPFLSRRPARVTVDQVGQMAIRPEFDGRDAPQ